MVATLPRETMRIDGAASADPLRKPSRPTMSGPRLLSQKYRVLTYLGISGSRMPPSCPATSPQLEGLRFRCTP